MLQHVAAGPFLSSLDLGFLCQPSFLVFTASTNSEKFPNVLEEADLTYIFGKIPNILEHFLGFVLTMLPQKRERSFSTAPPGTKPPAFF